ncbi:MAG: hypothetical protein VKL39_00765 [Leptolyngbyaceae bacterium]|nr:hypothetical protein [Leptolyngbyaceae bacterium]
MDLDPSALPPSEDSQPNIDYSDPDSSNTDQFNTDQSHTDQSNAEQPVSKWDDTFRISPIIRLTLNSLYGSLVLPLPLLAHQTDAPVPPAILVVGVVLGWFALIATLSEKVQVNPEGLRVSYGSWVPTFWRSGWSLRWEDVVALKPRSTGQGGIVYYFVNKKGEARLLPMRMAGFARFVRYVQQSTTIDTADVRPLAQPWMYLILFVLTGFLWLIDGWAVTQIL